MVVGGCVVGANAVSWKGYLDPLAKLFARQQTELETLRREMAKLEESGEAAGFAFGGTIRGLDGSQRDLATAVEGDVGRLDDELAAVVERLVAVEATRPRVEMDPQQRAEMQAHWTEVLCPSCGYAHTGTCPRVKSTDIEEVSDPQGRLIKRMVHTEFWPNDQWEPPEGAVSLWDVWGGPVIRSAEAIPAT